MGLINPWVLIGLGLAWLASLAGAFTGGIKIESDHRDAQQLVLERGQHEAYRAHGAVLNVIANKHERTRLEIQTVTQTITQQVDRIVDRPVYRDVCLDADGLRLVAAAIAGKPPDPGQPDPAVPAPAPAR